MGQCFALIVGDKGRKRRCRSHTAKGSEILCRRHFHQAFTGKVEVIATLREHTLTFRRMVPA